MPATHSKLRAAPGAGNDDDDGPGEYALPRFNPATMEDGSVVLMIGGRGTGKSTLLTDVCFHKRNIPDGIGMSGTEESNEGLSQFIPESYIYTDYNADVLKRAVSRARRINKMRKRQGLPKKYTFIIIDDCGCDSAFTRDATLRQILMNGRHCPYWLVVGSL